MNVSEIEHTKSTSPLQFPSNLVMYSFVCYSVQRKMQPLSVIHYYGPIGGTSREPGMSAHVCCVYQIFCYLLSYLLLSSNAK